jgi:hypothetical protein
VLEMERPLLFASPGACRKTDARRTGARVIAARVITQEPGGGMQERSGTLSDPGPATKDCLRCGGRALYWRTAMVPGDPLAPRGSGRALAHEQPAWTCINCGHLDAHERRAPSNDAEPRPIWRL